MITGEQVGAFGPARKGYFANDVEKDFYLCICTRTYLLSHQASQNHIVFYTLGVTEKYHGQHAAYNGKI
jgi:hypothetical protein